MDPREVEFEATLRELCHMWHEATGSADLHPHLLALLDPDFRRSPASLNYLVATASGTLLDREFAPSNGDVLPLEASVEFNERWRTQLRAAGHQARDLGFPAGGARDLDQ